MEKKELQNSTLILILGILAVIGCCFWGILGIIFGIITLVLSKKATEIYNENPEFYTGYGNVKTGKLLAVIGIVLGALYLLLIGIGLIFFGGFEMFQEEFMRQYPG